MAVSSSLQALLALKTKTGRCFRMMSLSSSTLSGCTQYFVVWRTKFCCLPPAEESPLTGLPRVRTVS